MATVERDSATLVEQRIVLHNVPWDAYQALLKANGEGPVRMAYDRGMLEIMAPSYYHELVSLFLDRLIGVLTEELDMEVRSGGSTTMHSESSRKGAEADQMYHIRHEAAVRGRRQFDPSLPPDLAVEVDISASSSRRLPIYSALGIPEVWRCDGERLMFLSLTDDGQYRAIPRSLSFPGVSPADLESFLARYDAAGENALVREFRQWVRQVAAAEQGPSEE